MLRFHFSSLAQTVISSSDKIYMTVVYEVLLSYVIMSEYCPRSNTGLRLLPPYN